MVKIMARIEFDEYKVKLENMEPKLTALGESLGLELSLIHI